MATSLTDRVDEQQEIARTECLLAALRCGRIRVALLQNEIDQIGVALRFRLLSFEGAIAWLREIGADQYVLLSLVTKDKNTS
jgi:hypothetical protein